MHVVGKQGDILRFDPANKLCGEKRKGNEYPPKCAQLKKFIRLITICKALLPGQTYETKHGENTEGIIAHFLGGLEEEH